MKPSLSIILSFFTIFPNGILALKGSKGQGPLEFFALDLFRSPEAVTDFEADIMLGDKKFNMIISPNLADSYVVSASCASAPCRRLGDLRYSLRTKVFPIELSPTSKAVDCLQDAKCQLAESDLSRVVDNGKEFSLNSALEDDARSTGRQPDDSVTNNRLIQEYKIDNSEESGNLTRQKGAPIHISRAAKRDVVIAPIRALKESNFVPNARHLLIITQLSPILKAKGSLVNETISLGSDDNMAIFNSTFFALTQVTSGNISTTNPGVLGVGVPHEFNLPRTQPSFLDLFDFTGIPRTMTIDFRNGDHKLIFGDFSKYLSSQNWRNGKKAQATDRSLLNEPAMAPLWIPRGLWNFMIKSFVVIPPPEESIDPIDFGLIIGKRANLEDAPETLPLLGQIDFSSPFNMIPSSILQPILDQMGLTDADKGTYAGKTVYRLSDCGAANAPRPSISIGLSGGNIMLSPEGMQTIIEQSCYLSFVADDTTNSLITGIQKITLGEPFFRSNPTTIDANELIIIFNPDTSIPCDLGQDDRFEDGPSFIFD